MVLRDVELSGALIELADTLVSDYELVDYLDRLLELCARQLGAVAGGVMLRDARMGLQLAACTDEGTRTLELFQLQQHEGPCIDSLASGEVVVETALSTCRSWPRFAPAALSCGYEAVVALPMRSGDEVIGALNAFLVGSVHIPPAAIRTARAFADMATLGIVHERAVREARTLAAQLQEALDSRVAIEQAKGMLAAGLGLEMDEAYRALRAHARSRGRRLGDVARDIASQRIPLSEVARPRHSQSG